MIAGWLIAFGIDADGGLPGQGSSGGWPARYAPLPPRRKRLTRTTVAHGLAEQNRWHRLRVWS